VSARRARGPTLGLCARSDFGRKMMARAGSDSRLGLLLVAEASLVSDLLSRARGLLNAIVSHRAGLPLTQRRPRHPATALASIALTVIVRYV
jgi:hypothetical protein